MGAKPDHRPRAWWAHNQIYALIDRFRRPLALLVTSGQVAADQAGAHLLERAPACRLIQTDKSDDNDANCSEKL